MARRPTTIRLSEAERDVLKAAARKTGTPYTTMLRRAGLDHATNVLSREVSSFRRQRHGEGSERGDD